MNAPTGSHAPQIAPPLPAPRPVREPAWLRGGQIPSLNGLRAASILLVLVGHLSHQGQFVPNHGRWAYLGGLGRLGVDMFFVISGFLITLLLIREHDRTGTISLKQFYLRRALRILPAYFFFLLGVGVLQALGQVVLHAKDWIGALTYTTSFVHKPSWDFGHLWSLSVEEHFYLVWPLAACLWPRRAWILAVAAVVATPAIRWAFRHHMPILDDGAPLLDDGYCSLTRMDTIAVGCCLAYLAVRADFRRFMQPLVRWGYAVSLALVALVGVSIQLSIRFPLHDVALHPFLVAFAYAVIIWIWTVRDDSLAGWLLNCRPVVAVGLLSYSIYLWQQPFLNPRSDEWFTRSPVNLGLVVLMAVASYFLIEKPVLQWKDRLSRKPEAPK